MNTTDTKPFTYFTNDQCLFVDDRMNAFRENPVDEVDYTSWDKDNIFDCMVDYLREHAHSHMEEVKAILSSMDILKAGEDDNFYDFLSAFCKDEKALDSLVAAYEDLLWTDDFLFYDFLDDERCNGNDMLKSDGFLGKDEKYIILGTNMGWRHRDGVKEVTISSLEDLERAVTGNYDYTISMERETENASWITCHVSSHDAPMGESYYCVPVKWLDKALEDETIKEMYDNMKHLLEDELESA